MLTRFISYYKPHKKLFFLDMFFAFLISLFDLIFPVFTKNMINDIIPEGNMRLLTIWTIVMLLLFIVRYISQYIVAYYGHLLGVKIEHDMRRDIFTHLQTLPFSYFDNTKTGHIMSRIINDLREITELAHHGPEDLFISTIMLIGSFVILLFVEWRLTLIIFAFIPVLIWFAINKRIRMENAFRKVRNRIANVNASWKTVFLESGSQNHSQTKNSKSRNSAKETQHLQKPEENPIRSWLNLLQEWV